VKDNRVYLREILERIRRIEMATKDGHKVFMESTLIQDAVTRNFGVIGEAGKGISSELRDNHPDVPWQQIACFRDILIHDYMSIIVEELWKTAESDLPTLKKRIAEILESLESNES